MNNPLCFVLMPFGKKPDATGIMIDFDAIYKELISPASSASYFVSPFLTISLYSMTFLSLRNLSYKSVALRNLTNVS